MKKTTNKVIIGYGYVGKSINHVLEIDKWVDEKREKNWNRLQEPDEIAKTDFFILCLPTPTKEDGTQDLSIIHGWLGEIKKHHFKQYPFPIVIIRSTILPGTTNKLIKQYGLNIVHVPEFLSEITAFEDTKNPELLVIGTSDPAVREEVKKLFANSTMEAKTSIFCDPTTAEMIKYTINSFFTLKVIFGNQLWDVCRKTGADYTALKNALEGHKWGSKNGWDVWHGGKRGYAGKCLPKDIKSFVSTFDLPLLKTMREINNKLLKETKNGR